MKQSANAYRHISLLLTCLLLPTAVKPATPIHADGVLWEVEDPGGVSSSHVLGTIHSDDPRVLDLDPAVERAFRPAIVDFVLAGCPIRFRA